MSGHGYVTPNADGSKARCGGPAICSTCAKELAAKQAASGVLPPAGTEMIVTRIADGTSHDRHPTGWTATTREALTGIQSATVIRPGDGVIVTLDSGTPHYLVDAIQTEMTHLFGDHKIMLVMGDIRITVVEGPDDVELARRVERGAARLAMER